MSATILLQGMEFSRRKTLELVEAIASQPNAAAVLGWRPAPGRAHIAWQLMHIAATDDRHLYVRMKQSEPREPEWVKRFAGGSVPDDAVPSLGDIRRYLTERRADMLAHLRSVPDAEFASKPHAQATWTYAEWCQVLAWHEAHHHGQAHLTYNLYRTTQEPAIPKVGH